MTRAKSVFLATSPRVTWAFGRRSVALRPTPKHPAVCEKKTSSTEGNILRNSGLERVYALNIYIVFVPLGSLNSMLIGRALLYEDCLGSR